MTRSTRRVDPFKSFSTNSNRFSHSIDSAMKEKASGSVSRINPNQIKTGEADNSDEMSFPEERERTKNNMSAKDKLYDLAQ